MFRAVRLCLVIAVALGAALTSAARAANYTVDTLVDFAKDEGGGKVVVYSGVTLTVQGTAGTPASITNISSYQIGSSSPGTEACMVINEYGTVGEASTGALLLGQNSPGRLEVNGGTFYAFTGTLGSNRDATVVMTAGNINFSSTVTAGYGAGINAALLLSGGQFNIDGASLRLGYGAGSNATMTVAGGSVAIGSAFNLGDSDSMGTLQVNGGAATAIGAGGTLTTYGTDHSVLGFAVGEVDLVTGLNITCVQAAHVDLSRGAVVDMSLAGFTPTYNQTFDLIKDLDGSIDISSLVLAAGDVGEWELVTNVDGDTLQARYVGVPEPATMGLLGLGLVGVVLRRRGR